MRSDKALLTARVWAAAVATLVMAASVILAPAAGAAPARRDVLVHAAGRLSDKISPIWIALVEQRDAGGASSAAAATERTTVLAREELGDKKWQALPEMPARVVQVAGHGSELVVVLAGKEPAGVRNWAWFSGNSPSNYRFSYGPGLPARVRLLAMAGDRKHLYALGLAAGADLNSTTKASAGAGDGPGASKRNPPSTRPAVPTLFVLNGEKWEPLDAPWPEDAGGAADDALSMLVVGEAIHVAVAGRDNVVRVYQFLRDTNQWELSDNVPVQARPRLVKLLSNEDRPALWIQTTEATGSLWTRRHQTARVQFTGNAPKPEDVDVTSSGDVRMFFRRENKLFEQQFNWDGVAAAQPTELVFTRVRTDAGPINWITTAVMTVLAVLLVSTLIRRRNMARDDERGEPEE